MHHRPTVVLLEHHPPISYRQGKVIKIILTLICLSEVASSRHVHPAQYNTYHHHHHHRFTSTTVEPLSETVPPIPPSPTRQNPVFRGDKDYNFNFGVEKGGDESPMVVDKRTGIKYNPYSKHHPGRHVCSNHRNVSHPVRTKRTFCRPVYKRYTVRCGNNQLCAGVRLVYEKFNKEVITSTNSSKTSYSCCPGWTQVTSWSSGCNRPVCQPSCQHGGACVKPGVCQCPSGFSGSYCETTIKTWVPAGCKPLPVCYNGGTCVPNQQQCICPAGYTGTNCESDMDECKELKPCDQICINTPGSFMCQCRENFTLLGDGQSCRREGDEDFAVETRDMDFAALSDRIDRLEELMNRSATNQVSKRDIDEIHANIDQIGRTISDMKSKMKSMDTFKKELQALKTKIQNLEETARQIEADNKRNSQAQAELERQRREKEQDGQPPTVVDNDLELLCICEGNDVPAPCRCSTTNQADDQECQPCRCDHTKKQQQQKRARQDTTSTNRKAPSRQLSQSQSRQGSRGNAEAIFQRVIASSTTDTEGEMSAANKSNTSVHTYTKRPERKATSLDGVGGSGGGYSSPSSGGSKRKRAGRSPPTATVPCPAFNNNNRDPTQPLEGDNSGRRRKSSTSADKKPKMKKKRSTATSPQGPHGSGCKCRKEDLDDPRCDHCKQFVTTITTTTRKIPSGKLCFCNIGKNNNNKTEEAQPEVCYKNHCYVDSAEEPTERRSSTTTPRGILVCYCCYCCGKPIEETSQNYERAKQMKRPLCCECEEQINEFSRNPPRR